MPPQPRVGCSRIRLVKLFHRLLSSSRSSTGSAGISALSFRRAAFARAAPSWSKKIRNYPHCVFNVQQDRYLLTCASRPWC